MKKLSLLLVTAIALTFLVSSCQKEKLASTVPQKVKIFLSVTSGSLKSTQESSVKNGDTVQIQRDVNVLMFAEDKKGQPVSGTWSIYQVADDYPSGYTSRNSIKGFVGDQIATKFQDNGIYKVSFGKFVDFGENDTLISFYVYVGGIPGKVGDNSSNGYIFRLEKKNLLNYNYDEKMIFVYFKYKYKVDNRAYYQVYGTNGTIRWTDYKKAKKWPFSKDNYYYFIIRQPFEGWSYKVIFMKAEDPSNPEGGAYVDPNTYVSAWSNGEDGIIFSVN